MKLAFKGRNWDRLTEGKEYRKIELKKYQK